MKVQAAVLTETKKIALGVLLLSVIMVIVFAVLGYFDYTVSLGALLGACGAIANFFFMAMTVQNITQQIHGVRKAGNHPQSEVAIKPTDTDELDLSDLEQEDDPLTPEEEADLREQTVWAKRKMQRSYGMRMLFMVAVGVVGLKVSVFHPVATLVPFLFPRIVISIWSLLSGKKGA